jgi:hypothetical protein
MAIHRPAALIPLGCGIHGGRLVLRKTQHHVDPNILLNRDLYLANPRLYKHI